MACAVPIYTFYSEAEVDTYNADGIYGSISAVTFITAGAFLSELKINYDGYMVAALALMESPAIIVRLILVNLFTADQKEREFSWSVLQEAFLNSSVFLLVGSLVIGVLTGEHGWQVLEPFTQGMFYGILTFFCSTWDWLPPAELKNCKNGCFPDRFCDNDPNRQCRHWTLLQNLSECPREMHFCLPSCASASYIAFSPCG